MKFVFKEGELFSAKTDASNGDVVTWKDKSYIVVSITRNYEFNAFYEGIVCHPIAQLRAKTIADERSIRGCMYCNQVLKLCKDCDDIM